MCIYPRPKLKIKGQWHLPLGNLPLWYIPMVVTVQINHPRGKSTSPPPQAGPLPPRRPRRSMWTTTPRTSGPPPPPPPPPPPRDQEPHPPPHPGKSHPPRPQWPQVQLPPTGSWTSPPQGTPMEPSPRTPTSVIAVTRQRSCKPGRWKPKFKLAQKTVPEAPYITPQARLNAPGDSYPHKERYTAVNVTDKQVPTGSGLRPRDMAQMSEEK